MEIKKAEPRDAGKLGEGPPGQWGPPQGGPPMTMGGVNRMTFCLFNMLTINICFTSL